MCMKTQNTDWNDINVAYQVAKLGTLTAAAETLNVHHSTILRRINNLEAELATRLFHRHARGYTVTEAGKLLMQVAENTHDSFELMLGQLQGKDTQLKGMLTITTINDFVPLLMPLVAEFKTIYPQIELNVAGESRIFKLEHGEAHISIRIGRKPQNPDYVVQPLPQVGTSLFASEAYIARKGLLQSINDTKEHHFIGMTDSFSRISYMRWMEENIPSNKIALRVNDFVHFISAIKAGIGAAPISCWIASKDKELKPLIATPPEWIHDLWLVTHRDVHRTPKVQAFNEFIKQRLKRDKNKMLHVATKTS